MLVSPAGGGVPFVPATGGVVARVRGDLVAAAGAAGGVGVSTLVGLLSPRPVMDLAVTRDWAGYRARWGAVPLVLVARGTAAGLRAAVDRVGGAVEAGVAVAALVVVADGPWPVPRAVRGRIRLLADYVDAVVRVPYVPAWRYVDDPLEVAAVPRKVTDALAALDRALDGRQNRRRG
ncbi:DUF6668 family protein [Frankia sp. AgPm24]|uniref:DUF6668 family protein n=1 Tax=Frankia sp. AgPm24 TaxID=631128 RepID=UPI0025520D34|nr:DUF6668 family protein [Frankia sp. AgPm24]